MAKLEYTCDAVNQRLSEGKVKARVLQRGGTLSLQATLPPPPGSARPKPYQQRVSLGLPANEDGFKRAEAEAKLLSSSIILGKFDWSLYLKPDRLPENKPARMWIEEFKQQYMETHTLKEPTWINQWDKIFKRLPQEQPLTTETLIALVHQTERNTRNRLHTCHKLQALADFAELKVNLLQFKGNYGPSKVQERVIPSDEAIAYWWGQIPNPSWQWLYGVLAAMGLRPHEAFFCKWVDDGLQVARGKTGPRLVFEALYPQWIEQWNLRDIQIPSINFEQSYEKLGDKVARQFSRYKIPFSPYSLRHAFAIRASVSFGLPVTTSASLMGHSPKEHLAKYHKHINLSHNKEAVERIINRPDAPKPPVVSPDFGEAAP